MTLRDRPGSGARPGAPRPVVLMFPGQGAQHARMAAALYGADPVFTTAMDTVFDLLGDLGGPVRADWLGGAPVDDTARAQPLLFAVGHALGAVVASWGVRPSAVLGHSAGELVAATVAGVFTLRDAVRLVRTRVRHAAEAPAGGMLAVAASPDDVRAHLGGAVALAAVNAKRQVMLAGPTAQLAVVEQRLRDDGWTVRRVAATTPFHSPVLAPIAAATERELHGIRLRPPRLPLYSGYTGDLLTPERAVEPGFWARQVTDTVHFGPALDRLLRGGPAVLVEAGPGTTLTSFARRHPLVRSGAAAAEALLPDAVDDPDAQARSVMRVAARLRAEGHDLVPGALDRLRRASTTTQ